MTREEFICAVEKAAPKEVTGEPVKVKQLTDKEYKLIEYVYQFHPAISEINGKRQIARLYVEFGMGIIRDMLPRAEVMQKLENEQRKAKAELERITALIEETRAGGEI